MLQDKTRYGVLAGMLLLLLVGCQGAAATPAPATPAVEVAGQVLTIGEVSSDPASKAEQLSPFVAYVAAQLADQGIVGGAVKVATDVETMQEYLKTGQVDLYLENFDLALTVYDTVGAQPFLRRWRNGIGEYHTDIVVRSDSGMTSLDDLKGHMIAFDRPISSTGDLLPRAYLLGLGYTLTEKSDPGDPVAPDEIGYVFAGSDDNIVAWVLQGQTVAGALQSDIFDELEDADKSQLMGLAATTPDMPRHIVLARPGLDPDLLARITEVLVNMSETPEGQAVLDEYGHTDRFDPLPLGPEGTMEMIREVLGPLH